MQGQRSCLTQAIWLWPQGFHNQGLQGCIDHIGERACNSCTHDVNDKIEVRLPDSHSIFRYCHLTIIIFEKKQLCNLCGISQSRPEHVEQARP